MYLDTVRAVDEFKTLEICRTFEAELAGWIFASWAWPLKKERERASKAVKDKEKEGHKAVRICNFKIGTSKEKD